MQEELLTGIFKAINSLSNDVKELKDDVKEIREEVRKNEANRIKDQKAILEEVRRNEANRQKDKKEMEKMFITLQEVVEEEIEALKANYKKHDAILEKYVQAV